MKSLNRLLRGFVLCVMLLYAAAAIFAGVTFDTGSGDFRADGVLTLDNALTQNGQVLGELPLDLTAEEGADVVTVSFPMPSEQPRDTYLHLTANAQHFEVLVGSEVCYTFGRGWEAAFGDDFGVVEHMIPLDTAKHGGTVALRMYPRVSDGKLQILTAALGYKDALLLQFWRTNMPAVTFAVIMLVLAMVFFLFWVNTSDHSVMSNTHGYLQLAAFAVLTAVWVLTDARILQLLGGDRAGWYILNYCCFLLMPLPVIGYVRDMLHRERARMHMALNVLALLLVVVLLVSLLAFVAFGQHLHILLRVGHVCIIAAIVVVIYAAVSGLLRKNCAMREVTIALGWLCVWSVLSLCSYYWDHKTLYPMFFQIGALGFLILLAQGLVREHILWVQAGLERDMYKRMAYVDTMTMLQNRAAFDLRMDSLDEETQGDARCIFVLDINGLKQVNDCCGHTSGDALICACAAVMRGVFAEQDLYRIGGDEFASILTGSNARNSAQIVENLQRRIADANQLDGATISLAIGYALDAAGTEKPSALFERADESMYQDKEATRKHRK